MKNIVSVLSSDEELDNFIVNKIKNIPICFDPSYFAGELKDLLSQFTSSYSYISEFLSNITYVEDVIIEKIEEQHSLLSSEIKVPYKKITEKQKSFLVKREKVKHIDICGVHYNNIYLQDLVWMRCRCSYLKNRIKAIQLTIDKSIFVGSTILSYNKIELQQLKMI